MLVVTRGFFGIPDRENGQNNIDNSWFDRLRNEGQGINTTRIELDFAEFQDAANSQAIIPFQLQAKEYFVNAIVKHSTAFSGGTLSAYTLSWGITGNLTKYFPVPFDVFQAVGANVDDRHNDLGAKPESYTAATDFKIEAISTGDTLDNVTAGVCEIWVRTVILP